MVFHNSLAVIGFQVCYSKRALVPTHALAPHAGDAYALCIYWRITHSAYLQNTPNKPMKFQDDNKNHTHYNYKNWYYFLYTVLLYYLYWLYVCTFVHFSNLIIMRVYLESSASHWSLLPSIKKAQINRIVFFLQVYICHTVSHILQFNGGDHTRWRWRDLAICQQDPSPTDPWRCIREPSQV